MKKPLSNAALAKILETATSEICSLLAICILKIQLIEF